MAPSFLKFLALLPAVFAAPVAEPKVQVTQVENAVEDRWIVRLKEGTDVARILSTFRSATPIETVHQYDIGDFKGFAFKGDASKVDRLIEAMPGVVSVQPDSKVSINELVQQSNAEWGLARISHRSPGYSNYIFDDSAGSGTYSYIIDTGINTDHQDFTGRASTGVSYVDGESEQDQNGHGTHVAGTVGGNRYGVAKYTRLIAVKVLGADGSGFNSDVLAGIDWAVKDAQNNGRTTRSVINMSLGGSADSQVNNAVNAAVRAGVFVAVAAGNDGIDARNASPASEPSVCTVGATDRNDNRASFSNFGPVVDVFGPGVDIRSAWIGSNSATNVISGTSMASPHIAGLGAYLLALEGTRKPGALCTRIKSLSTKNVVNDAGSGSPNNLGYNGSGY